MNHNIINTVVRKFHQIQYTETLVEFKKMFKCGTSKLLEEIDVLTYSLLYYQGEYSECYKSYSLEETDNGKKVVVLEHYVGDGDDYHFASHYYKDLETNKIYDSPYFVLDL